MTPDESFCENGGSPLVAGLYFGGSIWFQMVSLRKTDNRNDIPKDLILRVCACMTWKIFDSPSKAVSITAGLKLDITYIHTLECTSEVT